MRIIPVTTDSPQELTISYNKERLTFTFTFLPVVSCWVFDLYNETKQHDIIRSCPLVVGTPILYREPLDYILFVDDTSNEDVDPFSLNCLGSRCKLYIEDKTEIDKAIQQTI